ncbi:MAG: nucleotidyltransferase domain-containing protein [Chloroflexia bacterium]
MDTVRNDLGRTLQQVAERYAQVAQDVVGDNLISVVLFGSVARGQVRPDSDIDLLVICRELPTGIFRRREVLEPVRERLQEVLERLWDQGVYTDFVEVIKTMEEAERTHLLYLDMTEEAQILWDRDGFFAGILDRVRERLRELGARRKTLGRLCYWDLKPDFQPGEVIVL